MYVIKIDAIENAAYINTSTNTIVLSIEYATKFQRKIEAMTRLMELNSIGYLEKACNVWKKRYNIANSFYIKVEEIHEEKPESIIISHKSDPIPPEQKQISKEELVNAMINRFNAILAKQPCGLYCYRLKLDGYYPSFTWETIEKIYKEAGWEKAYINVDGSVYETYLTLYL